MQAQVDHKQQMLTNMQHIPYFRCRRKLKDNGVVALATEMHKVNRTGMSLTNLHTYIPAVKQACRVPVSNITTKELDWKMLSVAAQLCFIDIQNMWYEYLGEIWGKFHSTL